MVEAAMAWELEQEPDSKAGNVSGGLQMLLDRWRVQEEKLRVFEDSLKDVNALSTYRRVHENLEASIPHALSLAPNLPISVSDQGKRVCADGIPDIRVQDASCRLSARSHASIEEGLGFVVRGEEEVEEGLHSPGAPGDESLEEFERRVWGNLWKDEDFMIEDAGEGDRCTHLAAGESVEEFKNRIEGKMAATGLGLPVATITLKSVEDIANKELEETRCDIRLRGASDELMADSETKASGAITEDPVIEIIGACSGVASVSGQQGLNKVVSRPRSQPMTSTSDPGHEDQEREQVESCCVNLERGQGKTGAAESVEEFEKRIWGSLWDDFQSTDCATEALSKNKGLCADTVTALIPKMLVSETSANSQSTPVSQSRSANQHDVVSPGKRQEETEKSQRTLSSEQETHHSGHDICIIQKEADSPPQNESLETSESRIWGKLWKASASSSTGNTCAPADGWVHDTGMAVNILSPELFEEDDNPCSSSNLSGGENDNLNVLTKERANLVETFLAAETQRQTAREREQLRKDKEALRQQANAATMQQFLQNQLQLDQKKKLASLEREREMREQMYEQEQRVKELQLEMERSNADLKKLTDSWKMYEDQMELKKQKEKEEIVNKKIEEERRNTAAQRIAWAYRKRRCRVLRRCCTFIQKVFRGFLTRRKVQELKGQRCKAMKFLTAAVEEGNIERLIESSAEAKRLGLHKEVDLMKVEFARRKVCLLHEAEEAFQSQPLPEVEALITKAKNMGIAEDKLKELLKSAEQKRTAALEDLTRVAESGNIDDYEFCLEKAISLGLEEEASLIQERWNAAKAEVSSWLQQVVDGWEIGRQEAMEKVNDARRLGLTTIAEAAELAMADREKDAVRRLETSMSLGTLEEFHQCVRLAKRIGLGEVVGKYSTGFRKRVARAQKLLTQFAGRNDKEENRALLRESSALGLESEVGSVVRIIHTWVLEFIENLIRSSLSSVCRGDGFLGNWSELRVQGDHLGIGAEVLEDLAQSIHESVLLEHTQVERLMTVVFECDDMGCPVRWSGGTDKAKLDVRTLTLNSAGLDRIGCQPSRRLQEGFTEASPREICSLQRGLPLQSVSQNWHEVDRLRSRWRLQFFQANAKLVVSKNRGVALRLPEAHTDRSLKQGNHSSSSVDLTGEESFVHTVEGEDDMEHENEGDDDDDAWHVERLQLLADIQSLPSCTLTRTLLEQSAHCSRNELRGVTKLNITHEELTSLGEGIIGRWCPKLRTFMVDVNRLATLRGAFRGCEESLEYVFVKDNLLTDLGGLESLHNLKVLFLEGNSFSHIGPVTETPSKPEDKDLLGIVIPKASRNITSTLTPRLLCRNRQATTACAGTPNDSTSRGYLTSRILSGHLASHPWPKLKKLCLGYNRITKVSRLGSLCPNLEVLDLGSNQLVTLGGCQGKALAGLRNLRLLDVGQNKLKGRSLWEGLRHCPMLVSLVASRNRLTELPTHLGSVMLREIWLNGNAIRRLACQAWLPNLQRLYLQDNSIDDLEFLWGCPSLEVLDISFNSISELSQLNRMASFPRLRTLQMNDNPVSNEEEHLDKVLEAVPWLVELDNEPVEEVLRDKAIKSIFLKVMAVAGIQFLQEKAARAQCPFTALGNPGDVERQWVGVDTPRTPSAVPAGRGGNANPEAVKGFSITDVMHGKASSSVLWAAILEVYRMAETSPVLRTQLMCTEGSFSSAAASPRCRAAVEARWSCLAFQEMFEGHRKSFLCGTKETSLRKEFLTQEGKAGPQAADRELSGVKKDAGGAYDIDQCLKDHLEYTDSKYQEVFSECAEYRAEMECQMRRVRRVQALARGMLARKRYKRMRLVFQSERTARELLRREAEELRIQNGVLRIQAAWRRWKLQKATLMEVKVKAVTSLQALWRGFAARTRFRRALARLQYIDDDDYEYVAVDESEFALDPCVFEDKFIASRDQVLKEVSAGKCSMKPSEANEAKRETNCLPAIPAIQVIRSMGREDEESSSSASFGRLTVDKELEAQSDNQRQHKGSESPTQAVTGSNRTHQHFCENETVTTSGTNSVVDGSTTLPAATRAEETPTVQGADPAVTANKSPQLTARLQSQQSPTLSGPNIKVHVCGKEGRAEKKKATIAEISKDWGFKDERTAEAFMKARAKILKRAEKEKINHQDAQSRFRMFKARTEETLAHAPPVYTHVKQTARQPCKVEKETIEIPTEDPSLEERAFESGHSPAMAAHFGHPTVKKGSFRKSCPWGLSQGRVEDDGKDAVADDITLDEIEGWHPSYVGHLTGRKGNIRKSYPSGPWQDPLPAPRKTKTGQPHVSFHVENSGTQQR